MTEKFDKVYNSIFEGEVLKKIPVITVKDENPFMTIKEKIKFEIEIDKVFKPTIFKVYNPNKNLVKDLWDDDMKTYTVFYTADIPKKDDKFDKLFIANKIKEDMKQIISDIEDMKLVEGRPHAGMKNIHDGVPNRPFILIKLK